MPDGKAYNSLGQILAHGGEIGLGIAISRGASQAQIAAVIQRRYPELPGSDAERLYEISLAGSQAGLYINSLSRDVNIPLEAVPIQPSLFGVDPLGRRLFIAAEVTNPATGESVNIREPVDFTDTIGEMIRYLQGLIDAWADQSPDLVEALGGEQENLLEQYFLFAERRF